MDIFLNKLTQHAVNYAIRSGIGITATYAIRQTSRLLKTVDNDTDYRTLRALQEKLDGKIKIISPAIDMVELISARGNTTLESAVVLTKSLRWDIQSLGARLAKAANSEEESRRRNGKGKSKTAHQVEIREIIEDIRRLLERIEDAVPFINLAITTSGANLSTTLPPTVSPSRLLQASTFLTAGDTQFSMAPNKPVQVGPTFTLSLYMLFTGHAYRAFEQSENIRDTTWKEVIHKANVKLMRIPLSMAYDNQEPILGGEGNANEYAYRFEIVEDFDDDRVHSFEDYQTQPGPYGDIKLAGIREHLPIYQISKIFYADTGKILNIGSQDETNSPILLLKRDVNAIPPRKAMQETHDDWSVDQEDEDEGYMPEREASTAVEQDDSEDDPNDQIRRESSVLVLEDPSSNLSSTTDHLWKFPPDLDPEWLAFEVYTESEDSSSETSEAAGQEIPDDPPYSSVPANPSVHSPGRPELANEMARLELTSPPHTPRDDLHPSTLAPSSSQLSFNSRSNPMAFGGPIRTSLSLLEMLIRLTALQQFQQVSHLAIPDELLTFFLEESSTTGAGGDSDERRRTRLAARRKVGFDPYDESPVKRRGEEYQYNHVEEDEGRYSRGNTPFGAESPRFTGDRGMTPLGTPEPRLPYRSASYHPISSPRRDTTPLSPKLASSPISSARPRQATRPLDRVAQDMRTGEKAGSPLGKGIILDTDSTLGTSPGYE
ncbi:RanGTP-binding protein-domain-containing protein [Xylogone sp. PMI_703]|nr:RanGTP-binding protein-domain-containing protein [Xylogone sp. PMI_703]